MKRTFTKHASPAVKVHLLELLESQDPGVYRATMQALGHSLGRVVVESLGERKKVLLACTVEDADFLAQGLLSELMEGMGPNRVALACFWNDRVSFGKNPQTEIAPIRRRYIEPHGKQLDAVIVVKSIISTACVVRTNLLDLLEETKPRRIIVAAPVLYKDATKSLEQEFPEEIASKFEYLYFAKDSKRTNDGIVHPGIGGQVYKLLGLGNDKEKNHYNPTIVRARRRHLASVN
jgi:predicted phosphoribosyltransferase